MYEYAKQINANAKGLLLLVGPEACSLKSWLLHKLYNFLHSVRDSSFSDQGH